MATGGGGNDFSRCSVCLDNSRSTVAKHFCLECYDYFCTECVKCHKLPALKAHQINDLDFPDSVTAGDDLTVTGSDVLEQNDSGLRCNVALHHGQLIDTYCQDHDEVCCAICAVVKHGSCKTLSIAVASRNFKSSPEIKKIKDALTKNLALGKQEKTKRVDNIKNIGEQEQELIQEIDEYEGKLIAKIKELANASKEEIRSKHAEQKKTIRNEVTTLDSIMTTATAYLNKLDHADDKEILFANAKIGAIAARDGETLLWKMATEWREKELIYDVEELEEMFVQGLKSLGTMGHGGYKAAFQENIDVKRNDSSSEVLDMCLIDSGDLLLADFYSQKLKRFSSDFVYKDELELSISPRAVCKTGKQEVVVRTSEAVNVVSVGKPMKITSLFTLSGNGYGMTYDASTDELLACECDRVSVYSKTGNLLRTYDKDFHGEQIFSECRQIVLSENNRDIYVTDTCKGLIVLDNNGTVKMKVRVPGKDDAWSLCLLPGGICLVGGITSETIAMINKRGKLIGNLIKSNDGRGCTYSVMYHREHGRLLVGGEGVISVYTLSAKKNHNFEHIWQTSVSDATA